MDDSGARNRKYVTRFVVSPAELDVISGISRNLTFHVQSLVTNSSNAAGAETVPTSWSIFKERKKEDRGLNT
jgi:hypothetical protein